MKSHFAALSIAVVCSAGAASAADLIIDEPAPIVSETLDWSGPYAGVNAGYGWGNVKSVYGPIDPQGAFLGADLGYNQQFGQFVVGAEADIQWSGMAGSLTVIPGGAVIKGSVGYFGTVRGRAGIALDRLMPYVTAGVSYGHGTSTSTTGPGYTSSNDLLGWTAGAGVEYAVTDRVSLKAEYLYHDYGNVTYYAGTPVSETIHSSFGAVRAGFNFKF